MTKFICGLMLGSILTAGLGLTVSNDGDYWWQKNEMQRKQNFIEESNRDAQRNRERYQLKKEPC